MTNSLPEGLLRDGFSSIASQIIVKLMPLTRLSLNFAFDSQDANPSIDRFTYLGTVV
jgi:hypothetical protein